MFNHVDIETVRSRPRFKIKTTMSQDDFKKRLNRQFRMNQKALEGFVGEETSVIRLIKDKNKFWAPQLQIRVEEDDQDKNLIVIRGTFGPKPAIWTFFIFLYTLGVTGFLFFAMIWVVEYRIDVESNLVIWAWLSLLLIVGTYLASKIGQNLAKNHIKILKDFIEKVLKDDSKMKVEK